MEQWDEYVDVGYGVPRYAVMEILRTMRDSVEPDTERGYQKRISFCNIMKIAHNTGLGLTLLANCRCVGLSISCIEITDITEHAFTVCFDLK